jgi:hypothetical protein
VYQTRTTPQAAAGRTVRRTVGGAGPLAPIAAVSATLLGAGVAHADLHRIVDLDPTNLYDVVVDGTTVLTALQPDANGVLRFEISATGSVEIVPNGRGDVVPPSNVTDLGVSAITTRSALLRWTAPGDDGDDGTAAAYEISWSSDPGNLGPAGILAIAVPAPSAAGAPESFTLTRLPPSTTLHVAVRTRDDAGRWSDLSNIVTFTTLDEEGGPDTVPPATVGDLVVDGVDATRVDLSWTAVGDDGMSGRAAAYDLRRASAPIDASSFGSASPVGGIGAPAGAGTRESVSVTGLVPGTAYHFALVVVDDAGNRSGVSGSVAATTLPGDTAPLTPPAAPQAGYADGIISLTWPAVGAPQVVGYHVYRRPEGMGESRLTSSPIAETSYADAGVTSGQAYLYRVTAVDSTGIESPASAPTWIRAAPPAPSALAIERVYPNPVRDEAIFRLAIPEVGPGAPDGVRVTLDLYDVAGRRVGRVVDRYVMPGTREIRWSPGESGRSFAPGLYVSVLTAAGRSVRANVAIAR